MPRLHTLYLPGNGEGMPFAFILDQANPLMIEAAIAAWESFAEKCGARAIMFTTDTIDIDPEPADEADKPIDYYTTDHSGCDHPPLPDILDLVRAAHAAAWVPWEPANLDPESPKISTHREEACPALNDGMTGCPMHAPILEGPWVAWPYYAARTADGTVISRICEHGITHPTPEEYFSGFDTPHLCDGCPCAPVPDFSIVVSDLANTRLPRGTLLLGVKDDPTPVTAPPATAGGAMDAVRANIEDAYARSGLVAPSYPGLYPFLAAQDFPDAEPGSVRRGGTARIQPLGADGEPVGEAGVYDLAGPVTVAERVYVDPEENCFCGLPLGDCEHDGAASDMPVKAHVGPTAEELYDRPAQEACGAGTDGDRRCMYVKGHDGLHHFETGPFNRI